MMADMSKISGDIFNTAKAEATSPKKSQTLGQEDFLRLLVTQMSHQDPLDPQDPGDFIGQMAQFGTVDGVNRLNDSFNQMNAQLQSNQALHASAMVGRKVHTPNHLGVLDAKHGLQGSVNLVEPVNDLRVAFKDVNGETVKQLSLGTKPAGMAEFTWNGISDQGLPLPSGQYTMVAEATMNGKHVALPTNVVSNVDSVTLGQNGQGIYLNLRGLGAVKMSDVEKIV